MVTKTKECQHHTVSGLRKASADLDAIESKISQQILEAAKSLLDGGHIDPSSFAGNFRVYEMVQDRFNTYKEGYENHQERCGCDIPDDLDGIW